MNIEQRARKLLAEEVGCAVEDLEAAFIQRDDALRAIARALEASYHPCISILIEGLKRLEGGAAYLLAEWDRARAQVDAGTMGQVETVGRNRDIVGEIREIGPDTIAQDFARNPRIHRCWQLRRRYR